AMSSRRPPCGSPRSTGTTRHSAPIASIRRRVSSSPATLRPLTATLAPSAASRIAIAVPVPPALAPVTTATIPSPPRPPIGIPAPLIEPSDPVTGRSRVPAFDQMLHEPGDTLARHEVAGFALAVDPHPRLVEEDQLLLRRGDVVERLHLQ